MRSRRAPTIVDAALTLGAHHAVAMATRRGYVAAMGETSLMTAEELLRLNLPDKRTELIRGRLVVRDPGGARHGAVALQLGYRIMRHAEAHDLVGVVVTANGPARVYRADGREPLLGTNETLDGEDVLPGFRCPLADLW